MWPNDHESGMNVVKWRWYNGHNSENVMEMNDIFKTQHTPQLKLLIYITLTLLVLELWLNFAWYHLITSYFCKVFYLNCNMVGSCVTTNFFIFFLHSILIFELCIMIIWLLLQSISLLDCMMVGSCVTTMIVFVSNLSFKHFLKSHCMLKITM